MGKIVDFISKNESILAIINSCLKNNGKNQEHSRRLILDKYRSPRNGNLSSHDFQFLSVKAAIEILKYFADMYLDKIKRNGHDLNVPLYLLYNEIRDEKITGKDLQLIHSKSPDEIMSDAKSNEMSPYHNLLRSFREGILAEHFNSGRLYGDNCLESAMPGEKLMNAGIYYSKRIYMNLPSKSEITVCFGILFAKKCIEKSIPFDMKLIGSISHNYGDLDGTIFYSKNKYFEQHYYIVREILEEYPEFKKFIGSPIYTGGSVIDDDGNCYFAISYGCMFTATGNFAGTYNDAVDYVINMSYVYTCLEVIWEFYPFFCNKFEKGIISEIKELINGEKSVFMLDRLKRIENIVREQVYDYITFKKQQNDTTNVNNYMQKCMSRNIKLFKSLINFGDLSHINNHMYEDSSFLLFKRQLSLRESSQSKSQSKR